MASEVVEENLEDVIAAEVIKQSKDDLERIVHFWPIVHSARQSGLVQDAFIYQLMKKGFLEISNSLLLSMFMDTIRMEEGWFGRFLHLLSDSYSYRPLAEQLSRCYREILAEKRGVHPASKLLEILHNTVETLKKCKAELQKVQNCHGLVSVQHCVNMLGMAVDHLCLKVKITKEQIPNIKTKDVSMLKDLPGKADHDLPTPFSYITKGQPLPEPTVESSEGHKSRVKDGGVTVQHPEKSQWPTVESSERHKSRVKDGGVTVQHPEKSQWGYSEVQVVHEVLKCNRGYLEQAIPIDVIISTLHAQGVLLDYEYHEVTSQPFPIKRNRTLLDALLRKAPSVFYQFCSILESQRGYEYIARYLMREIQALDQTIPLEDKMKNFGITLSPKGAGPMSKTISQVVDALVDTDMVKSSIQSIMDKQIEMAEDVKKVHETEVSRLRKAVSDAKDTVNIVKTECVGFFQQMEQGKVDSSDHVIFLQGKMQEIVQACDKFQSKKVSSTGSSMETLIDAVSLECRISHLTTELVKKERELESWRGTAERRGKRLSESQKRYNKLIIEHDELRNSKDSEVQDLRNKWETSQAKTAAVELELSKYQKKCDNLVVEHKEMRNKKDREIEDLWNEWGTSQAKAAAVELELSGYQKKYDDLVVEHKEMRNKKDREIEGLWIKWEASQARTMEVEAKLTFSEERCKSLVAQHEELKNTKNKEIADIRHELETKTLAFEKNLKLAKDNGPQTELLLDRQEVNGHKSEQKGAKTTPATIKDEYSPSEGSSLKPLTHFAPVSGSWECSSCYNQNTSDAVKCVCCEVNRSENSSSSSDSELERMREEELREEEEEERLREREEKLRLKEEELALLQREREARLQERRLREERRRALVLRKKRLEEAQLQERYSKLYSSLERGYYSSLKLNKSDIEKNLQKKAVNGEHSVWGEGEENLNLSVWQDGKCYHLTISQKDVANEASYSLDERIYCESILQLCNLYKQKQLPGYDFKLCQ